MAGGDDGGPDRGSGATTRSERLSSIGLALVFAAIAGLAGLDLASDLGEGLTLRHALVEASVVAVGLAGLGWMLLRLARLAAETRALEMRAGELAADLEASRREAARWRSEAGDLISGLGAAIDGQLERWGLSPAEQEVALLLLKGLSHKEIGELRGTGEATVRQQSRSVYRKAGLTGRHDLAAFFLEDLLDPHAPSRKDTAARS